MNAAGLCAFSTHNTSAAPRLKHSRLNAPEPANNSRTFAPITRAPSELKIACLTKSGVGRTSRPFGTFRIRRAALPPVMRIALFENFREKLFHRFPRTFVGFFVVFRAGIDKAGVGLRESVNRAAVENNLPVHFRVPHFILKRSQVGRVLKRIVRAREYEHLAFDVFAIRWRGRIQAAVKTDHAVQFRATAREFDDGCSPETIADGSDAP